MKIFTNWQWQPPHSCPNLTPFYVLLMPCLLRRELATSSCLPIQPTKQHLTRFEAPRPSHFITNSPSQLTSALKWIWPLISCDFVTDIKRNFANISTIRNVLISAYSRSQFSEEPIFLLISNALSRKINFFSLKHDYQKFSVFWLA